METAIQHTEGLCHKVNMTGREGQFISFAEFQQNPLSCRCCGTKLVPRDSLSNSFRRLGMFEVVCPQCP